MTIQQASAASGDAKGASGEKNALEHVLLQSQSSLVMLREMNHQRERKWQEIAELYGYHEGPSSSSLALSAHDSDVTPASRDASSSSSDALGHVDMQGLTTRLVALNHQRAHLSRVVLAKKRLKSEPSSGRYAREQTRQLEHAAVKALVEATQNQHRLAHALGASAGHARSSNADTSLLPATMHSLLLAVQPPDVEALLRFEYTKRRTALPFERLFVRTRWLCTSHRYHVRQRMLALFHQQRTKNAPAPMHTMVEKIRNLNAVTASNPTGGLLHSPLFVLSSIQLEAELSKLMRRHLPAFPSKIAGRSEASDEIGISSINIAELKVQAEQLFYQIVKVTAIRSSSLSTANGSCSDVETEDHSGESENSGDFKSALDASEPFFASGGADTHWSIHQLGILDNGSGDSDTRCGMGSKFTTEPSQSAHEHEYDDDPLLRSEWELLRLDDCEYVRARVGALARSHFERAKVDLTESATANMSRTIDAHNADSLATRSSQPASSKESGQLFDLDEGDELMSADAIYALYLLRVVSCRTERHRLLRLLNYLHYITLCRNLVGEEADGDADAWAGGDIERKPTSSSTDAPARIQHPVSRLRVEKRESEYVVLESRARNSAFTAGIRDDTIPDDEMMLPAALQDLEIMERHMLRTASVFVSKQERASLPSRRTTTATPNSTHVMAIDRMQVICDIYECELGLMQAKLRLVQLLMDNGLEHSLDERSSEPNDLLDTTSALFSVLRRRPLVDFTHAYFYESYAAETLHLELQISLQQLIRDHFAACEQEDERLVTPGHDSTFHCSLDRQIIRADLVSNLYQRQCKLVRDAEQQWMCVRAVGELHALHQALYEQLLVHWKLIVSVELAATPAQCLERSGGSVLSGSGWQLVFPTKLVLDCCRNAHQQQQQLRTATQSQLVVNNVSVDARIDSIATMAKALAVIEWHQSLGRQVYEAKLLERVYAFQYGFAREMHASKAAIRFFFDDTASNERSRGDVSTPRNSLIPAALELIGERDFAHLTTGSPADSSKTIPEWLEAQLLSFPSLAALNTPTRSSDSEADASFASSQCHSLLLDFQKHWTRFLGTVVRYQDLIGSEIFEFASSSPFLFLEASSSGRASSTRSTGTPAAAATANHSTSETNARSPMSAKSIQSRYAEEVAEKMKDEMQQNCYPYWSSLERVKEQVKRRFEGGGVALSTQDDVTAAAAFKSEESELEEGPASVAAMMQRQQLVRRFAACAQYLRAEAAVPQRLVRVDCLLRRLRGERALMETLGPSAVSACAFTPSGVSEEHDSSKKSTLTRWLTAKLQQLRDDLHSGCDATPQASSVAGASGTARAAALYGNDVEEVDSRLLLSVPSHLYLIDQFAVPLCRELPTGPTLSTVQATTNNERIDTLRLLGSVLEAFHVGMDLLRVKSALLLSVAKRSDHVTTGRNHANKRVARSVRGRRTRTLSGQGRLLEQWQILYHDELRRFHDRILEGLQPAVASCNMYARCNADKVKFANRSQREALQAIRSSVVGAETALTVSLQCTTSFLLLRSVSTQRSAKGGEASESPDQQTDRQRTRLRHCLLELSARLRELHKRRVVECAASADSECKVPAVGFPVMEFSASELLHVFHQPTAIPATASERSSDLSAFWDELGTVEREKPHVKALTRWLDLQLVFLAEFIRPAVGRTSLRRCGSKRSVGVLAIAARKLEVSAASALDKLWDRYELLAGEEEVLDPQQCQDPATQYHYLAVSARGHHFLSQQELEHRLEFLRLCFELQWLQADIQKMERHYEAFLDQKSRSQRRSSHTAFLSGSHSQWPPHSTLLALAQFYHHPRDDNATESPPWIGAQDGVFVVPASEMSLLLERLSTECVQHHTRQSGTYERVIASLQSQLTAAQSSLHRLQERATHAVQQEQIKREAFAIDHAYHLRLRMKQLRNEAAATARRQDLERLELESQLTDAFSTKLASMHAQLLLANQQRFDAFRVTIQHGVSAQLQSAQAQLVHDLVDHSGAVSVETKAAYLADLHAQHASDHVVNENVALKQTLLKLQTLLETQRQSQRVDREREHVLLRRHKVASVLARDEAAQLQQRVRQLEADVAQSSHDRTHYMLQWSSLYKQTEQAAQKKRTAKIRSLSAPYHRSATGTSGYCPPEAEEEPTQSLAAAMGVMERPQHQPTHNSFEDDEDAFERLHEVAIRRPLPASAESKPAAHSHDTTNERRFENSTRHYQNEIRRLQQQLAKESKAKAALMEQVTQLRASVPVPSLSLSDPNANSQTLESATDVTQLVAATQSSCGYLRPREMTPGSGTRAARSGRVLTMAPAPSPRTRAQSASVSTPTRPLHPSGLEGVAAGVARTRPSTFFSPRSVLASGTASVTRKFDVQKRSDAGVGGVAGVPNALSIREPLPYR